MQQAIADIAAAIKAGYYEMGIAFGVETMTRDGSSMDWNVDLNLADASDATAEVRANARKCAVPMGITSENIAERWNIGRGAQDAIAVRSHARAARARKSGLFDAEIVPVFAKDSAEISKWVTEDEGIREGVSMETLAELPPAFQDGGSTTAGNSCQRSDGAGCVVVARRAYAESRGLPILGAHTFRFTLAHACIMITISILTKYNHVQLTLSRLPWLAWIRR
jgi:acetyl-CoA acyltransferase 1